MKRINNETVLDTVYDLADSNGMRIDRFLELIEEEYGAKPISTKGLPEEIVTELENARLTAKEHKKQLREQKDDEIMAEEIALFREIFSDIPADSIPDSVWEEVASGIPLAYAYALYEVKSKRLGARADDVNARNGNVSEMAVQNGNTEPSFTKEQVERMSGGDVRKNYKSILKAMKSWKF